MASTLNRIRPADRMAHLPPYFFSGLNARIAKLRAQGKDIIRMDMGSPDMPPAPFIIEALKKSADSPASHAYMPFGGTIEYREAWAHFYGRRFGVEFDPQTESVGLLGSKEGIFNLSMAYLNPGDISLIPDPGYAPYTMGARMAGAQPFYLPLTAENNFLPNLKSIPPDVLKRARLLWLNYPNNPTGAVATLEFFAEAAVFARRHGILIAHDAPYTEITFDGYVAPSILQAPGAKEVCLEFHTVSKTYNMAGWRVGIAVGTPPIITALASFKTNSDSSTFKPILDASAAALTGDQSWIAGRNAHYRERRDLIVSALRQLGLQCETPAAAMYVWAKLPDGLSEVDYADRVLEEAGVTLTPGSIFGPSGAGYVRLSVGTPTSKVREAMERLVKWAGAS